MNDRTNDLSAPSQPLISESDLKDRSIADIRPLPPRWRSILPAWLRSLLWVEEASSFDAFLSYSWKSDSSFAPILQSTLQSFLCPWYKLRALNIFRDLSSLAASADLEASLREKLDASTHLIVLASPLAKTSEGMQFEAKYWLSKPRRGQILVLATSGDYGRWTDLRENALRTLRLFQITPCAMPLLGRLSRRAPQAATRRAEQLPSG